MKLRRGQPLWLSDGHAPRAPRYPALADQHTADIAVIGGGLTGAITSLFFAESGASVTLIEASRVARGSTAASAALLLKETDRGVLALSQRYGEKAAKRIWHLSHDAVEDLLAVLTRLRIPCNLTGSDAVYYAPTAAAAEALQAEFRFRTQCGGFGGRWLKAGTLRDLTGIAGHGAIRTSGNARFNPFRACVGLLEAASAAGVEIFEQSPVLSIRPHLDRFRVRTRRGSVDAARVVIATGYATKQFRPLAGRFRMSHTYVLATERLSASSRREVGLGPVMVWDTERPYHYLRWTADGRLLLGGGDRPVRRGQRGQGGAAGFQAGTQRLRAEFETILPALAQISVKHAWEGLFATTPDTLPYIGPHRHYPGHLFALGYGGNGMTFSCLAARMLVEQWQGVTSPDHSLFAFGRFR